MAKELIATNVEDERAVRSAMHGFLKEEMGQEFFPKLYSKGDQLPFITNVKMAEVQDFAFAVWYANRYHQPWLQELVEFNLELRVSARREGRKEAIQALVGGIEQRVRSVLRIKKTEG